ncbi:hypothetical protein [Streptomyces sp. NPDC048623]|uniref:hypothetical protein n=1 Tax=Streptomyces sp. NPDC048623 TaxID=3155761 RepID=UPI00342D40E0
MKRYMEWNPTDSADAHSRRTGSFLSDRHPKAPGIRLLDHVDCDLGVQKPLAERVHAAERSCAESRQGFRFNAGPTGLGTSAARMFRPAAAEPAAPPRLDVLWTRKRVAGSPLAAHVDAVRRRLADSPGSHRPGGWVYDPEATLAAMKSDPTAWGAQFTPWMMECAEMVEHGRDLLGQIREVRGKGFGFTASGQVGLAPLKVGADPVGAMLARARLGENAGQSTKSNLSTCSSPEWAAFMDEFGFQGVGAYPNFASGAWGGGMMPAVYDDWRQDYVAMLIYGFYLEYNIDTAYAETSGNSLTHEILSLWDMPDMPADLVARRAHVEADLAFFDVKRRDEADAHQSVTSGLATWVYRDRDTWRDMKAADSGYFTYHLSFLPNHAGRDDMMLTGAVADWADIGPDLRFQECGNSILAMTRGSVVMEDLLDAYERTVWMVNAHWTETGEIRPERYAACTAVMAVPPWLLTNHRHDAWRYYALAADLSHIAERRDLYASGQLADCYTEDLTPTTPVDTPRIDVPRRELPFDVEIDGIRHTGTVRLHTVICDAVARGTLPMGLVEYEFVVPWLLREGTITPAAFLAHMDRAYCRHFAQFMRAGHSSDFKRSFSEPMSALIMEQYWHGMYFAIGAGSLVEAQPDAIAGDRAHDETSSS